MIDARSAHVADRYDGIDRLSMRERQVLELIARGCSNRAIADDLAVSEGAVEKHVGNMFIKLDLAPSARSHRRVLAALTFLRDRPPG